MKTYNSLLHSHQKEIIEAGLSNQTLKLFLFELCNEENINLYLEIDNEVKESILNKYNDGLKRLIKGEPLNYVLGYSYFYGYKMIVNKDVLIPRFETEELVGLILSKYDEYYKGKQVIACDVGTGSGAIAIAVKKEEDNFEMYASDISLKAIEVSKLNGQNNGADVCFMVGDMLEPIKEKGLKLDILISNPPYIPNNEKMEKSVVDFEPHVALFGGDDGLKFYRTLLSNSKSVMNEHGMIFFEIGYDQKERMINLAKDYYKDAYIEVYKDINGKDRMFYLKF